jgi:hypothetical protein
MHQKIRLLLKVIGERGGAGGEREERRGGEREGGERRGEREREMMMMEMHT